MTPTSWMNVAIRPGTRNRSGSSTRPHPQTASRLLSTASPPTLGHGRRPRLLFLGDKPRRSRARRPTSARPKTRPTLTNPRNKPRGAFGSFMRVWRCPPGHPGRVALSGHGVCTTRTITSRRKPRAAQPPPGRTSPGPASSSLSTRLMMRLRDDLENCLTPMRQVWSGLLSPEVALLSCCITPNHVHLVLRGEERVQISGLMRTVAGEFARASNERMKKVSGEIIAPGTPSWAS